LKKFCITGGGTGGHLAIAKTIAKTTQDMNIETIFIGSESGQDRDYFQDSPLFKEKYFLKTSGVVNKKGIKKIFSLLNIFKAFLHVRKILKEQNIDLVFSVGGFSAAPASFAALSLGIPLVIHEQNAYTGTLNRILKKYATVFFSSYDKDSPIKDYPVDDIFFDMSRIRKTIKTVIFLGGSQGARYINELAIELAPLLQEKNIHIIHQTGKNEYNKIKTSYQKLGINAEVYGFTDKLPQLMHKADLAISRSGASTLWELTANALPALFIPYPYAANDHQYHNARFLEEKGVVWIQKQTQDPKNKLLEILDNNLEEKSKTLQSMLKKDGARKMIQYLQTKVLS